MNTKVLYSTYFMRFILLLFIVPAFQACIDNKYDLDKDLSLEISVGGKHLAVPLGSTSNIYLDSLVDAKDGDILNFLENGDFALFKTDSLDIKIPKLDPVNITVNGLDIDPISVSVDNIQLPDQFTLGNFSENIPLGADNIELSVASMQPIGVNKQKNMEAGVEGAPIPANTKVTLEETKGFQFSFQKVDEIQDVKTVYFGDTEKGSLAQVTIKLPEIITTTDHVIEDFSVTLPAGFILAADPASIAGTVSGNTFSVTNYDPGTQKTINFSFYIRQMSGNFSTNATEISYSDDLQCSVDYKVVSGKFNQTGTAEIGLEINIPLSMRSADIATQDIPVQLAEQNINVNSKIEDIPQEIASVKTIYFDEAGNEINVSVSPLTLPVNLSGNDDVQLKFPAEFHFKPSDGLAAGNILNIPVAELNAGTVKTLHLESIELNQDIQNQEIVLNKNITLLGTSLQLDASPSVNTKELETLSDKKIQVEVSGADLKISHADVTTAGITIDIDRAKADMDISEETPKELIAVRDVAFKESPEVRLHLSFEGIPASVNKVKFKDYTVTFPEFLIFEGNDIQNHQLVLNDEVTVSDGFSKTLIIKQFSFGDNNPIANGHITINDSIILDGQLYIEESGLNSNELTHITIRPTVNITPMGLGLVTGKIDPEIDPEKEIVDIGDIPDFMKDDSVVLDIMHPLITVNAGNTIGVPVNADLKIQPMQKGNVITGGVVDASIEIEPTPALGTTRWSNFWISDTQEGMPSGYSYVSTPNLPNLIRKVPDSISIVVTAEVDPDALHSIDLSIPEYKLQVKYNISVPIKLGKDLNIIYHDTIDDFNKDIEDYVKYVTEAQVLTEIDNTIPLEMTCSAQAVDVNKKVLKGIKVSAPQKVEAAGWDAINGKTTLTQTSFSLLLEETVRGEMTKLDGLVFKISAKANSTVAGATLKKDQYLKITAKMKVPGGVTVDIDDL